MKLPYVSNEMTSPGNIPGENSEYDDVWTFDTEYTQELVFVQYLGKSVEFSISMTQKISELQSLIEEKFVIPVADQKLTHLGSPVTSTHSLGDYGIRVGDLLTLTIEFRGQKS